MIEPNEYEINLKSAPQDYLKAGFQQRSGFFRLSRPLYKYNSQATYVTLTVLVEDDWLVVNVSDDTGNAYAPFYNPKLRHDNLVCDAVIAKYNNIMDELVNRRILKKKRRKKSGKD